MHIELNDEEARLLRQALANYISNLREEIVKTEAHEWRKGLHKEEQVLSNLERRLH
jgi:hypothetical protein